MTTPPPERVETVEIQQEMADSFLEYAMSVIVSRALPDVRDGLKPVHRRILFAMFDGGMRPGTPFRKCSRVVGDVVGWFHPHDGNAVYDALARLAQDFSTRYPLVDPQGNFGTVDDRPAAMRYCVTGDTLVRTAEGTVRIDAITPRAAPNSDNDIDLKVLDRRGELVAASKLFHSGTHPTLRLVTREGFELTGTHNHPVLTLTPLAGVPTLVWRLLEELRPGDRVAIARTDDVLHGDPVEPAQAWSLGRLARTSGDSIPDGIWRADAVAKRAFITGLSTGSSAPRTASRRLARDAQMLLLELGIVTRLMTDARGCRLERVDSVDSVPWLDECVASEPVDDPGMASLIEHLVGHGYFYAEVAEIVDAGEQPVYSIKVESEDHSFLANGFVNHNTEARLAPLAMHLLEGINEDTVDWMDNYSGEREEPTVLPARFPNLLVNGSTGIAVGMATNMAPHNLGEVTDAIIHAIDNPGATSEDLMQFVKGPDFPTGSYIVGTKGIRDALLTGRGSIRQRAVADVVELNKRTAIIFTETPYQVSRDRITARIAELVHAKTITGIADVRDESDRTGTRLVIELRRDAQPQVILNQLYKLTQLEESFAVNNVALVDGVPRTLGLGDLVHHYIAHQLEVIERRTRYRLGKAYDRAHIVEGLLIALDNIDEVVQIIRSSADVDVARSTLMSRFELSDIQANHILDMPLRRLTALETDKLREEYEELQRTIEELEAILASEARRRALVAAELREVADKYADPRRTRIIPDEGDLSLEDLIADEELVVSVTTGGYIKSVLAGSYRTQGRGGRGIKGAALREDDVISHVLHTTAHAYLLFFTNLGKVYRLRAHEVPRKDRTAKGVLVQSVLPLGPEERVEAIIDTRDYETFRYLVAFTKQGQVKKTRFTEYESRVQVLNAIRLAEGDEVVAVQATTGDNEVVMFTRDGMGIRFKESDVRSMGRDTQGVRGIKLRAGDEVVAAASMAEGDEILLLTTGGYGKRTAVSEFRPQTRGGIGVKAMKLTRVRGTLVDAKAVSRGDEIVAMSSDGIVIRQSVDSISRQRRDSTGVKVMGLAAGAALSAVALVPRDETNGSEEV